MRSALSTSIALALMACDPGAGLTDDGRGTVESELTLCAAGAVTEGIDVSVYQGTINWGAVAASGKKFAVIRAAHGLTADTKFSTNWAGAKNAGMLRGAYAWLVPTLDVTQQANLMIQAMATLGPADLPPVIDVEEVGGKTPAQLAALVGQWITLVKNATGRTPIVYSGSYFWDDYVKTTSYNTSPLWLPHYGVTCPRMPAAWSIWTFHQYSSTGAVSGISGNVDLDRFNGSLAQLTAFVSGTTPTPVDGVLTGAIYENSNTAARLSGVTVKAGTLSVTTAAEGLYKFTLPPGTYTVTASKAGFTDSTVTRIVTAGTTVWGSMGLFTSAPPPPPPPPAGTVKPVVAINFPTANAVLELANLTLAGTATDDGGPLSSVSVRLNGGAATSAPVTAGRFGVDVKLRAGVNSLEVSATDAMGNVGTASHSVTFRSGLQGTVIDAATRAPVLTASVRLLSAAGVEVANANGSPWQLDAAPGEYELVVSAPGFTPLRTPIAVSDAERLSPVVELSVGDENPPAVRFTSPEGGAHVETGSVRVEGVGVGATLARVKVNGLVATVVDNTFAVSVPLTVGQNTLEVIAFDTTGRKLTQTMVVTRVDTGAPPPPMVVNRGCSAAGGGLPALGLLLLVLTSMRGRTAASVARHRHPHPVTAWPRARSEAEAAGPVQSER